MEHKKSNDMKTLMEILEEEIKKAHQNGNREVVGELLELQIRLIDKALINREVAQYIYLGK